MPKIADMPKVTGITIERNTDGIPRYARIDLRKFPEFIPMLCRKGAIEYQPNEKTLKAIQEAENDENLKTYTSVKELFEDLENGI